MQNPQYVKRAAGILQKRLPKAFLQTPPCAIILGTGLSGAAPKLCRQAEIIPFSELPHFPAASVQSHAGSFYAGMAGTLPVLIQQGRCHLYEGRAPEEVCMGVRVLALAGCRELIITNAAGALNPLFSAGSLMLMADIINYTGVSPLTGLAEGDFGPRFPDMSQPLDTDLAALARQCALALAMPLCEGVYLGLHGPEMETRAETRMYRQWGADAVGMSTVLEIIAARQMGLKCLGISCLTNKNLPDRMEPAPIEEVVAQAQKCGPALTALLAEVLRKLAQSR